MPHHRNQLHKAVCFKNLPVIWEPKDTGVSFCWKDEDRRSVKKSNSLMWQHHRRKGMQLNKFKRPISMKIVVEGNKG